MNTAFIADICRGATGGRPLRSNGRAQVPPLQLNRFGISQSSRHCFLAGLIFLGKIAFLRSRRQPRLVYFHLNLSELPVVLGVG